MTWSAELPKLWWAIACIALWVMRCVAEHPFSYSEFSAVLCCAVLS